MLEYKASEDDLARLATASARRGVRAADSLRRRVRRAVNEEAQLQAFCEWLGGQGLNILGTVTFSDEYAEARRIFSFAAATRDVEQGLRILPMKRGRVIGFAGRFVLACEWHRTGRSVPHVHLLLDSNGAPADRLCRELWRHFTSRGRSRFEPMRDFNTSTLYGLKDTVKQAADDPTALAVRLTRTAVRRGKR